MNHREPPQVPQGTRRGRHFLSLLLLAAAQEMGLISAHAGTLFPAPQAGCSATRAGYLPARGAPPLRFAEIIVPAGPASQMAASASSPSARATSAQAGARKGNPDQPASADVSLRPPAPTEEAGNGSTPGKRSPLPILPDEGRPQVRPEDFLPYFQIPGSGQNPGVTVLVPVPAGQANPPPQTSSATYLQTDK